MLLSAVMTMFFIAICEHVCTSLRVLMNTHAAAALERANAVVIGSGPAGLATAIMLAKRGTTNIRLFDQLPEPPSSTDEKWGRFDSARSYNIGLSGRGQKVLKALGALPIIEQASSEMRLSLTWSPETPINSPSTRDLRRPLYQTICLERDRLSACLVEEIRANYSDRISLDFDTQCTHIEWKNFGSTDESCIVQVKSKTSEGGSSVVALETPFVVGADGTNSVVRDMMSAQSSRLRLKTYVDTNTYVYRTIPLHPPHQGDLGLGELYGNGSAYWDSGLTYSARSKVNINIEALPTKEGVYLAVVLYRPQDPIMSALQTAQDAQDFFKTHFPMFIPFLKHENLLEFVSKGDSKFQRFQYCGPDLHCGRSACLVGDSIHTVKPYFGLGVNSAFEDIAVLEESLREHSNDLGSALKAYSISRANEAKALVEVSQHFDKGLLHFLVPLIADRVLHKLLPSLFSPPLLTLMQDERNGFVQVRRRKLRERLVLATMTAGSMYGAARLARGAFRVMLKALL